MVLALTGQLSVDTFAAWLPMIKSKVSRLGHQPTASSWNRHGCSSRLFATSCGQSPNESSANQTRTPCRNWPRWASQIRTGASQLCSSTATGSVTWLSLSSSRMEGETLPRLGDETGRLMCAAPFFLQEVGIFIALQEGASLGWHHRRGACKDWNAACASTLFSQHVYRLALCPPQWADNSCPWHARLTEQRAQTHVSPSNCHKAQRWPF
mmetsp:Transcript_53645/g.124853  ORF Transcript_53645/g.124853 Transcript_53645/m.124853 type:complete len:210 (+) Transcript_53645:1944-2573(+)